MYKDPESPNYVIGVIGAGAMGQGIVQVALQGGLNVILHDARDGGARAGRDAVYGRLNRLVEKGRLESGEAEAMQTRVTVASSLEDFASCDVVVEAVFEDLELKQEIFTTLESVVRDDCILASNTSSLLIASVARACKIRGRVAGLHFFNPVPLMRLVEVIQGPETDRQAAESLKTLGKRLGRTPVIVKDAPGFLVNFGGRAYTTEGMRILHEGAATPAQIDAVMRDCCAFRMGPCELMDLTGVDVNYPVTQIVYEGYDHDPRLKTSFPHRALLEAGNLGRKTGAGNYTYDTKGQRTDSASGDYLTDATPATKIIVAEANAKLNTFLTEIGLQVVDDDGESPIFAAPVGEDCAGLSARTGVDYKRLVAIDLLCDTSKRVTLMTAPGTGNEALSAIAASVIASGRAVTAIGDSAGFISQRMRAMVANLGCEMAQISIASPKEIDLAMKLGLNYPLGPLEMVEDLGDKTLLSLLETLQNISGEDRYRPSQWLRRRALLDLPIHTPS